MAGMVMDAVLMLLLVCAVGYGVRLEKKLTALRTGQMAFAGAVTELNAAAGRAEAALASLRASGQETDLLHDRIVKAREVKAELERLIARVDRGSSVSSSLAADPPRRAAHREGKRDLSSPHRGEGDHAQQGGGAPRATSAGEESDERALRMAALAQRIQGFDRPSARAPGRDNVSAIVQALTANQAAKQSLNAARRNLDDDLFAA